VDELIPDYGPIRNVLKVNVYGKKNLYYDETTKGYRWPARRADRHAKGSYGSLRRSPVVKECWMGALLALPATMDLYSLGVETRPSRILAATLQNYGAYIVDDTAWDVYVLVRERSPTGRFTNEFKKNWGFTRCLFACVCIGSHKILL